MAQVGAETAMSRPSLPRGVLSEEARQALIEGLVEMALAELRVLEDDPDAVVGTEDRTDPVSLVSGDPAGHSSVQHRDPGRVGGGYTPRPSPASGLQVHPPSYARAKGGRPLATAGPPGLVTDYACRAWE